jgi:acyl dehydratase
VTTPPAVVGAIPATVVGVEAGPLTQSIDSRWLMAYAAGLGERDPRYYDTTRPGGPAAHALFAVCYEWPALLAVRARVLDAALAGRGVHATHRLRVHRAPRAGDVLSTAARVIGLERRRAGTLLTVRLTTLDADGAAVTTTDHGSFFRGVTIEGEVAATAPAARRLPGAAAGWTELVDVATPVAHVYSECSRIWNPIHTDVAVARAAGLPDIILHGTATLALAVSRVITRELDGDPSRVREVAATFTGMVRLPSRFTVRGIPGDGTAIAFDAVAADGTTVLDHGRLGA